MFHLTDSIKVRPIYEADLDRRRSLFGVLLMATLILYVPLFVCNLLAIYFGQAIPKLDTAFKLDGVPMVVVSGSLSLLTLVGFFLNRAKRLSAIRASAAVCILILTAFIFLSDAPEQFVAGRTSFMLLVPIFLASVLVYPASGLIVALLEMLVFLVIAPAHAVINIFSLVLIYFFSIMTWISAHSAESAIAAALREGTKNKSIFSSTADGLIVYDPEGKPIQINQSALKMLDGMDPLDLLKAVVGESETGIWKIGTKNGRTLAVTKAAMIEEGQNAGTVLGARDFTREVMVEKMKDAILGIISHELRTPAAAIKGAVDVLRFSNEAFSAATVAVMIGTVNTNVQRLLLLLNNLLDQASLQAGTLKFIKSPFSISSLIAKVQDVVLPQLEEKAGRVELQFQVEEHLPNWLVGDANRLWQIMVNLIGNAVKFTDTGEVCVRLGLPQPDRWTIEVSDTGIGIPAPVLEFIFEPIRRAPDYATRKYQGAGLGLSITKQLVTLMKGNIDVRSTVGQGSVFTVTLPMEAAE